MTSRDRGTCSGWRLQTSQQEAGFWAEVPRAQPLHAAGALSLRPPCTPRPGPGRCPHCGRGSEGSRGPPAAGGRGRAARAGRARGSGWLWAASGWGLGHPSFSLAGSVATSALSPLAEQAPCHRHGVTTRSAAHSAARGASVHLCRSPRGQGLKGARCPASQCPAPPAASRRLRPTGPLPCCVCTGPLREGVVLPSRATSLPRGPCGGRGSFPLKHVNTSWSVWNALPGSPQGDCSGSRTF